MDILTVLVISTLNLVCFFVGAKLGQTVVKGKDIELPNINPMEIYKAQQSRKEAEAEKNKLDTIMRNIDKYDGTDAGQEEVR